MPTLGPHEAFIHDWEPKSPNYAARCMPPDIDRLSDYEWNKCSINYTLLPLDGRHQDAKYRFTFELNRTPAGTETTIGERVTRVEFPLESFVRMGLVHLSGLGPDGEELVQLRYDQETATARFGEVDAYATLTVSLEYKEALLEAQAHQYDSLAAARAKFVDYIERRNERGGSEIDPYATFETN